MSFDREAAELVEEAISGSRPTAGWYRVKCPWCLAEGHDSKKKNLHVSTRGFYQCWRCGEEGWLRRAPSEAAELAPPPKPEDAKLFDPPEGFVELDEGGEGFSLAPARRYVHSRGISDEAVRALRIGACPLGTPFPWAGRVVVPHLDERGRWLGWVGRAWVAKPPPRVLPYLYPAGMRRSVFNARVLSVETDEPALLFEGALDVAHYFDRAAAFFGTPTEAHVKEIEEKARRPVVVVLDGDLPDVCEMLGLRFRLDGLRAGSVVLPPRVDPDEVPRDWLLEEARRAVRNAPGAR